MINRPNKPPFQFGLAWMFAATLLAIPPAYWIAYPWEAPCPTTILTEWIGWEQEGLIVVQLSAAWVVVVLSGVATWRYWSRRSTQLEWRWEPSDSG